MLIDPVCFLTCYPQLLYSFVYKVPLLSETLSSINGLLSAARFLFSRDLIIAEVCCFDCMPGSTASAQQHLHETVCHASFS